ncbi:uncharacterized protein [Phyllobates terribilis]|uniref:uncharacterized protein n=1 Tax=Phyllobates terribilis TaxID=111132 RepID=UPI003CCAD906
MNSSRRSCLNDPDSFCYICGEYTLPKHRRNITDFVKKVYLAYFGVMLGDQDKFWAPHIVCKACIELLRKWSRGQRKSFKFGVPMVWREQKNHHDDCYFCAVQVQGFNKHKKRKWEYPTMESARRPVPHCEDVPVPVFTMLPDLPPPDDDEMQGMELSISSGSEPEYEGSFRTPTQFTQGELNDLIRDLNLSKSASELLASRLSEKNCLTPGTKITSYRTREEALLQFFCEDDLLVYCKDIPGLMLQMGLQVYRPEDWRLFIDSSKRSLKCVLLNNGNQCASLPVAHSTKLVEQYKNVKMVLEKLCYHEHSWLICVDLKMVNFLLGQQSGYTKYPCFICMWDSRAKHQHWEKVDWPPRDTLTVGASNIVNEPLVDWEKIILPPLHIKLGLMKQFVKALDGNCFMYICRSFPGLSSEKLKAGIFDGPQIRKLIKDSNFPKEMNDMEAAAWCSFVLVVKNFLGNKKADNYEELVQNMLLRFRNLGVIWVYT